MHPRGSRPLQICSHGLCGHASTDALESTELVRTPQGLLELAERYPIIDVRGRGLMVAAEFGEPGGGSKAPAGLAAKITKACGKRNMILLSAGAPCALINEKKCVCLNDPPHPGGTPPLCIPHASCQKRDIRFSNPPASACKCSD